MPDSFGLVVEGTYDEAAISEFIMRLTSAAAFIRAYTCGGVAGVMQKFPAYLAALQYEFQGGPVEKALVVVDSNGRNPAALEAQMQNKISGRTYSFREGVRFCVVVREIEAWLLGDLNAINTIPSNRGGGRATLRLNQSPEALVDPKVELERRLSQRGVGYTSAMARRIAAAADLGMLERHCHSFADFRQKVQDC
ncbi:MAG: hypothetical protein DMG28_05205 [Acidobacteria bacterium]|nr:MAG: hypothetical protein DMG28_05205 [Acidobacteriota bacterium]